MDITEEVFIKALGLCIEIRREYRECLSKCLDNTALSGYGCFDLCREKVARRYNLSLRAVIKCVSIERCG